jgi:multiple sugar transport system ATP-binding protein
MAGIEIRGLAKVFPSGIRALQGIDLDVADGELTVLVGRSGSGKTTLLRLVAGLEAPSGGTLRLNGKDVDGVPPHQRNVALVFQNLALYSHLTVADNLAFGLKHGQKAEDSAGQNRVTEVAEVLGISHLLDRYPAELSGGEQQRVALGRAIVRRPAALLLDEPLSSLDAPVRRNLRRELKQVQRQLGVPTIYVTHDQAEALALGDRIAVLDQGKLQQVATPDEIYNRPANRFVAEFFGVHGMNMIDLQETITDSRRVFVGFGLSFRVPLADNGELPKSIEAATCGFRPEDASIGPPGDERQQNGRGLVEGYEALGDRAYVQVRLPNETRLMIQLDKDATPPGLGDAVSITVNTAKLHWFKYHEGTRI